MNAKQFFNKLKSSLKGHKRQDGEYMHPVRHWLFGLSASVFVFLLGVGLIAFDFYTQFGVVSTPDTPIDQQVTYPEKEVRRLSEQYQARQREFEELRRQRPAPPAPPAKEEVVTEPESVPVQIEDAALAE